MHTHLSNHPHTNPCENNVLLPIPPSLMGEQLKETSLEDLTMYQTVMVLRNHHHRNLFHQGGISYGARVHKDWIKFYD